MVLGTFKCGSWQAVSPPLVLNQGPLPVSQFVGGPGGIAGSLCPPICQRRAKWSLLRAGFPLDSELSQAGVLMEARCWRSSGDRDSPWETLIFQ